MNLEAVKVLLEAQDKTFKTALDVIVEQLNSRIKQSEETIADLVKSLEFSQAEVKELQSEILVLKKSTSDNTSTMNTMKARIEELKSKTEYQEDYNRRKNLRITGLREQSGGESWEETVQLVTKLLEDKLQVPTLKLEKAHRVGQGNHLRHRTIIARFEKYGDRETVLRNAHKLKGTGVYVNEDLCQASQEIRNKQLPLLKEARGRGKIAFFKHTKLIIKERVSRRDGGDVIATGNVRGEQTGGSGDVTVARGVWGGQPAPSSAGCGAGLVGREGVPSAAPVPEVPPPVDGATSSTGGGGDGASPRVGSFGVAAGDLRVGGGAVQKQPKLLRSNRKK